MREEGQAPMPDTTGITIPLEKRHNMKKIIYLIYFMLILLWASFLKEQWDHRTRSSADLLNGQYYDYGIKSDYIFTYGENVLKTEDVQELSPEEYYSFKESTVLTVYVQWDTNLRRCKILREKQGDCTEYCLLESPKYGYLLIPPYEADYFFRFARPLAFYLRE